MNLHSKTVCDTLYHHSIHHFRVTSIPCQYENITIFSLSPGLTVRRDHSSQLSIPSRHYCFTRSLRRILPVLQKDNISIQPQETSCASSSSSILHTLMKPISWLFSRKHCRQMLRPYFRIRPALWVQTRLLGWWVRLADDSRLVAGRSCGSVGGLTYR